MSIKKKQIGFDPRALYRRRDGCVRSAGPSYGCFIPEKLKGLDPGLNPEHMYL